MTISKFEQLNLNPFFPPKSHTHQVFVKMSKRNSIINTELRSPLRRSPRLIHNQQNTPAPQKPNTPESKPRKIRLLSSNSHSKPRKDCLKIRTPLELCGSDSGLRRSPRLSNGVDVLQSLRRFSRFSNKQNAEEPVKNKTSEDKGKKSINRGSNKRKGKCEVGVGSCERTEVIGFGIVLGLKAVKKNEGERKVGDVVKGIEEIKINKKRKRGEEGKESSKIQGWTKEQEVALQRAYFVIKPTPRFWKKVSKLVPGKSAQDCFDKVHADHVTPSLRQRQSRANKLNSSPLKQFSLSASKLLKPIEPKIKSSSFNKRKSHLAQRTVRHLLQKTSHRDPGYEADIFSVLEPNMNPSTQVCEQSGLVSTPKHLHGKQEFLQKCHERSSGHKKPPTVFSNSCGMPLVSPPVLKQVKNRALHEKYIDQLLCREAKRKAASARAERFITGKENRGAINSQKIDVVRAAKDALVSDARNVINQLQRLNENATSNSSDADCDGIDCNDDESETEL